MYCIFSIFEYISPALPGSANKEPNINTTMMDSQLFSLKRKAEHYQEILKNTEDYRAAWQNELKDQIIQHLQTLNEQLELNAEIETRSEMENLEAILFSLGETRSGMYQKVNDDIKRHLIKHNGSLIYQQLFNGKVIVLINYPFIEGYGKPAPPKTVAIYRPEELKEPFFIRHMEEFLVEITRWEDYDDEEPQPQHQRIGFDMNFGQTEQQEG